MKKENPQAAPTDGQASAVASEAQNPQTETSPENTDEELRRFAVARLADHLEMGVSLVARCEHFAELPKGDRLNPLFAAARLMNANANVAKAFAQVAQVDRRQRTIIERVQPPAAQNTDSNSTLEYDLERMIRLKMLGYMAIVVSERFDPVLKEAFDDAEHAAEEESAAPASGAAS